LNELPRHFTSWGILAAVVLSALAIESLNALRRPEWSSDVVTTAVNVVPALLGGVLVYGLTALWLRRGRSAIVQLAYARGVRDYRGPVSRLDSVGRNLAMGE